MLLFWFLQQMNSIKYKQFEEHSQWKLKQKLIQKSFQNFDKNTEQKHNSYSMEHGIIDFLLFVKLRTCAVHNFISQMLHSIH